MSLISRIEHQLPASQYSLGLSEVDHSRGEQTDPRVTMLLVVPVEKLLTEDAAVLDTAETIRKIRPILQGAKLAFRIRVVVGNVRPAVRLGDAQVSHQKSDGLGGHDLAAVGMDGELPGGDLVFADGFFDELLGQFGAFPRCNHPTNDVAAEHVQDDVEIEVGPLDRTQQFGDVPTPELVRSGGQQLGPVVGRMDELIAPFAGLSLLLQDAVHGAARAQVTAFRLTGWPEQPPATDPEIALHVR